MIDASIEQLAAGLYDSSLPYHNFAHALSVVREGNKIVEQCHAGGVSVDAAVVYYACLFHDAGYHKDHTALGYESKEAYSADLAAEALVSEGVDPDTIERVREAILATHWNGNCRSLEARAVRAADLSGLASPYAVFRDNAMKLKRESEMLGRREINWEQWRDDACRHMESYLAVKLDLPGAAPGTCGGAEFESRARENIRRLQGEGQAAA